MKVTFKGVFINDATNPLCSLKRASNVTPPSQTWQTIDFQGGVGDGGGSTHESSLCDTYGMHNLNQFTSCMFAPESGWYLIVAYVNWMDTSNTGDRQIRFLINDSVVEGKVDVLAHTGHEYQTAHALTYLNADDYIEVEVWSSGTVPTIDTVQLKASKLSDTVTP